MSQWSTGRRLAVVFVATALLVPGVTVAADDGGSVLDDGNATDEGPILTVTDGGNATEGTEGGSTTSGVSATVEAGNATVSATAPANATTVAVGIESEPGPVAATVAADGDGTTASTAVPTAVSTTGQPTAAGPAEGGIDVGTSVAVSATDADRLVRIGTGTALDVERFDAPSPGAEDSPPRRQSARRPRTASSPDQGGDPPDSGGAEVLVATVRRSQLEERAPPVAKRRPVRGGNRGAVFVPAGAAVASVALGGGITVAGSAGRGSMRAAITGPPWRRVVGALADRVSERLIDTPLSPLAPVFGYSRYDDSDPLANETRASIHEVVTDAPGIYHAKLADSIGVAPETIRYHGRVLEEEGLITRAKMGGRRRLFPTSLDGGDPELAAALSDPAPAAVLGAIARESPMTVSELADEIDRAPSTVSHHLDRLEDDGLLTRDRRGKAVEVRVSQHVEDVVGAQGAAGD